MSRARPAHVRFYFDADVLGIARILSRLRPDITFPGDPSATVHLRERPPCPIMSTATPDTEWILVVAQAGWLIDPLADADGPLIYAATHSGLRRI